MDGLPRIRKELQDLIFQRLTANEFVGGEVHFTVSRKESSKKSPGVYWVRTQVPSELILVTPPGESNVAYRGHLTFKKSAKDFLAGLNALNDTKKTAKDYLVEPIVQMPPKVQDTSSSEPFIQRSVVPTPPAPVVVPVVPQPQAVVATPVVPTSKIQEDPGVRFSAPHGRHSKPSVAVEEPKKYIPSDFTEELLAIFFQVFLLLWNSKPEEVKDKKFIMPGEFAEFLNSHSLCPKGRFLEKWNAGKALTRLVEDRKICVFKKGLKCFYTLRPVKLQTKQRETVVHKPQNPLLLDVDSIPAIIAEHKELLSVEDQIQNREPRLDEEISQLTSEIEVLKERLKRAKDDREEIARQKSDLEKRKKVNNPQFEQVQKLKAALGSLD